MHRPPRSYLGRFLATIWVATPIALSIWCCHRLLKVLVNTAGFGHGWGWPLEFVMAPYLTAFIRDHTPRVLFPALLPFLCFSLSGLFRRNLVMANTALLTSHVYFLCLVAGAFVAVDEHGNIRRHWNRQPDSCLYVIGLILAGHALIWIFAGRPVPRFIRRS